MKLKIILVAVLLSVSALVHARKFSVSTNLLGYAQL